MCMFIWLLDEDEYVHLCGLTSAMPFAVKISIKCVCDLRSWGGLLGSTCALCSHGQGMHHLLPLIVIVLLCDRLMAFEKPSWIHDKVRKRGAQAQAVVRTHGEQANPIHPNPLSQENDFNQEDIALVALLKICTNQADLYKGNLLHADVLKRGSLKNIFIGNTLVNMYARCGALAKAQQVFDDLPVRNVVSYNALIAGYAQHGHNQEALVCFERMHGEGLAHNAVTFLSTLKACCSLETADKGKEIHAELARRGVLGNNIDISNTLMDMYVKCGALARAQQVFDEISVRTVVSWNVLISGYAQHGLGEEALNCFEQMQDEGLSPDAVTFLCILKACGSIGAAEKGEGIHAEIVRQRMMESNYVLGNALVDMYAKCGVLKKAQQVFSELHVRDVVSWTALMVGFVQVGKHDIVFHLFGRMTQEGIRPSRVTFVVVLNACSHLGVVDEGQLYFETISASYGIIPTLEHHTCMVDLFSRSGHFDEAMAVVKKMPSFDYLPTWYALLGACKQWGNVNLGRSVFEHAVRLDKKTALAYVYMSDMYAALGMQEEADCIEAMKTKNEAWT